MSNLYLIGFRGSGKTTVAPRVAQMLGWQSLDVDEQISVATGQTITEIFETDGQPVFRQWETTVLQAIATQTEKVVSVGGGAPMLESNREIMRRSGKTVWLRGSPGVLWDRIQADAATQTNRPRLTEHDGLAEVEHLLAERNDTYAACADYTVDVDPLSPDQVAERIAQWWQPVDK